MNTKNFLKELLEKIKSGEKTCLDNREQFLIEENIQSYNIENIILILEILYKLYGNIDSLRTIIKIKKAGCNEAIKTLQEIATEYTNNFNKALETNKDTKKIADKFSKFLSRK